MSRIEQALGLAAATAAIALAFLGAAVLGACGGFLIRTGDTELLVRVVAALIVRAFD